MILQIEGIDWMVKLTKAEILNTYNFAVYAWGNQSQSQKQFGTGSTRTKEQFIADQIEGKLAEYIFKKQIEEEFPGTLVELDFLHYNNPLHTDNGDVKIVDNGQDLKYRIDIKGSSYRAQWLLIERHKFWDKESGDPMADCYVMVKFGESMPTNPQLRLNPELILQLEEVEGSIVGGANHNQFLSNADKNLPWFDFKENQNPYRPWLLPDYLGYANNKKHLDNFIKLKIRNNKNGWKTHLEVELNAKSNISLPIKWLFTDMAKLLSLKIPKRV